jgi:hypothetical protein
MAFIALTRSVDNSATSEYCYYYYGSSSLGLDIADHHSMTLNASLGCRTAFSRAFYHLNIRRLTVTVNGITLGV